MSNFQTVYIICSNQSNPEVEIAGLSVGERLLLCLSFGGIHQVTFLGDGPRPISARAEINEIAPNWQDIGAQEEVLVMPSDLVFDGGLLKDISMIPPQLPLRTVSGAKLFESKDSLDGFVNELGIGQAQSGKDFALRVVGAPTKKQATRSLYLSLIKPIDGIVSKKINRKVSLFITRFLIQSPVTPNGLTIGIMLLGLLSGVAAYFAEYWWALVLAGVLFQTQSMLDGCDGEIARLKYQFSKKGQWLDSIGDDVTNYTFCLGLAFGQARVLGWDWLYLLGGIVFVVQWYCSFLMYQRIYKMNTGDLLAIPNMVSGGAPKGRLGAILRVIHTMTKRDFFVFVTSILAAVQLPLASFGLIALGSFLFVPSLTLNELRIRKAIKAGELDLPL